MCQCTQIDTYSSSQGAKNEACNISDVDDLIILIVKHSMIILCGNIGIMVLETVGAVLEDQYKARGIWCLANLISGNLHGNYESNGK